MSLQLNLDTEAVKKELALLASVRQCLELKDKYANSKEVVELKNTLKQLKPEQKKSLGATLNDYKKTLQNLVDQRIQQIQTEQMTDSYIDFDPTFFYNKTDLSPAQIHPITKVILEISEIFKNLGFDVYDGNQILSQWQNFTAVNTPNYHPARDMQDTFFLDSLCDNQENMVLRTQSTANFPIYAQIQNPPFRVIFPGVVFRNENIDATHDINFHQFDCWLVEEKTSIGKLIKLLETVFSLFFNDKDLKIRLRPSYFPFTSPSMECDFSCPFCKGQGCRVCKQTGWIEVLGCGLIHPEVLEKAGIDTEKYTGLAFGLGIDRLVQIKYGLTGISQFYNGNLDFLSV